MKWRLFLATILLCPMLMGSVLIPSYGQSSADTEQANARRTPARIARQADVPLAPQVSKGLRYFRFHAGRSMPDTAMASPKPANTQTIRIPLPARHSAREATKRTRAAGKDMWSSCRRGMRNIGRALSSQVASLQAFGRWCHSTSSTLVTACTNIADSCRRIGKSTEHFSKEAQAATTGTFPAEQQAQQTTYRYIWVNQRGDCIFTQNPKLNPNQGGAKTWHRVGHR